jgi:cytochrome c553
VFQADLDAARRGVQSEPPNYTLAENVAGACVHCHEHSTR